tara:strand:- start:685 stop:996 length:312 start_codon:yes stop_codon:yes gene_type:complete
MSSEKIMLFACQSTKEIDIKIFWEPYDVPGWTARIVAIPKNGDREEFCLLLDQYADVIRLETVVEFFSQDYLPKNWSNDFSQWYFGCDQTKYASTTFPLIWKV